MLCQVLLTAIAISCTFSSEITVHALDQGPLRLVEIKDVICVLLMSGLQKEDLDMNTLEKLMWHNVNIYDMNNESLREECLLKSFSDTTKVINTVITKDPNDAPVKRLDKPNTDSNVADILKSEILTPENYFVDKINLQEVNIKGLLQREEKRNDDVNSSTGDINVTVTAENQNQQFKYMENPSLENVLNFWAAFTKKSSTETIKETNTTQSLLRKQNKVDTDTTTTSRSRSVNSVNEGYVHSREMGYISRIIAEYLGSQTVTPTTQVTTKKSRNNLEIVSRNIKDILAMNKKLYTINMPINMEDIFGKSVNKISELAAITKANKKDDAPEKSLRESFREPNNYEKGQIEINIPYKSLLNFSATTVDSKADKKRQIIQFLKDVLKANDKPKLNVPLIYTNTRAKKTITHEQEKKENGKKNNDSENINIKSNEAELVKNIKRKNDTAKERDVLPDIIQEIAEKVKAMVIRDIIKEIPKTELPVSCTTTLITTNSPLITTTSATTTSSATSTTPSTTVIPTTPTKQTNESSVIQTLMELFKEFKTMKKATKATTHIPTKVTLNYEKSMLRNLSFDNIDPSIIDALSSFEIKMPVAKVEPTTMNPYHKNITPVPFSQLLAAVHGSPTNFYQNAENKAHPITIQTNSAEIPPLAIQIAKPMKLMNQHIILTTQKSIENQYLLDKFPESNHHEENPLYADLTKNLRIGENVKNEHRESYKDILQKLKDRINYAHGLNLDRGHETNFRYSSEHPVDSLLSVIPYNTFNKELVSNRHKIFNKPAPGNHHEPYNRPLVLNRHKSSITRHPQHEILSRSPDSNYHDIIPREFFNRPVDSNHHDVRSQLVEASDLNSKPNEKVDLNHQSRSHQSDAYERFEHEQSHSRYKAPKFHEKLEGLENRPQNSLESYKRMTKKGCCETVVAREQVPLAKIKQPSKFDDNHFKNFLKSQQKVTDMLERILAAKTKARSQSSEME